MNSFLALFTGYEGRINRSRWWFGAVALLVIFMAVAVILMVMGLGEQATYSGNTTTEGQGSSQFWGMNYSLNPWANIVLTVLWNIAAAMIGIKRRHDRDNSGLDVIVFAVISILASLAFALGLTGPVLFVLQLALSLGGIYLFIVLGCLKGTNGPNSYGPDPLGGGA